MNKTADIQRQCQTGYMFIRTVADSKTQPCITFVETRSGEVISSMCARKGGYEDLSKEILRHFEAYGFRPLFSATKRGVSLTCVEKLHANETREQCKICAKKQVIRATGLPNQYTDIFRDSHDATRHKSRRTLAYRIQQFHLPFHLRFVTLDFCSQDSQCDPTAEPHSNICSELHMYHLCACLLNRYSR